MQVDDFGNRRDMVNKILTNSRGEVHRYGFGDATNAFLLNDGRFAINGIWGMDRQVKFMRCWDLKILGTINPFMVEGPPGFLNVLYEGESILQANVARTIGLEH